jgi:hypothetical protein
MPIKPPAWLLLGLLLWLSGCGPPRVPAPDAPRQLGSIPTPPATTLPAARPASPTATTVRSTRRLAAGGRATRPGSPGSGGLVRSRGGLGEAWETLLGGASRRCGHVGWR